MKNDESTRNGTGDKKGRHEVQITMSRKKRNGTRGMEKGQNALTMRH